MSARPSDVAAALGVRVAAIRLMHSAPSDVLVASEYRSGTQTRPERNAHWMIRSDDGEYVVLRRYRAGHSRASVDYEHGVLRHLADKGWPVAAPLAAPVEAGGRWWTLFPRLPGRNQQWDRDDRRHRWRGELLARLHADTAELVGRGQRDDWHRRDEVAEVTPERVALLTRLRTLDAPRAVAFERHARQIAEGVSFLRAGTFPMTVVHGDFLPWNLRVRGTSLVGVLDFDMAHRDTRASDVAFATWGGRYPTVVEGYTTSSPLTEEEEAALPLLWRAAWLSWGWTLLARTRDRVEPELDAVLEKFTRPWGE